MPSWSSVLTVVPARWFSIKHNSSFRSMQKISLSSLRISELIENPRPSTHKRRLFRRFELGMIGMHDSTGINASFIITNQQLIDLNNNLQTNIVRHYYM